MNKKDIAVWDIIVKVRIWLEKILPWIIFPCASFYLMETFHHNPFINLKEKAHILNIIIFVAFALFLWTITGSRRWALRIESLIALIIGVANYYVIEFRGVPILPWDIYSVKTAAIVSPDYDFSLETTAIFSILAFLVVILLESLCKEHKLDRKRWRLRLAGGALSFGVLFGQYQMLKSPEFIAEMNLYDKLFTPYAMIKRDGIALAFMMELQYMEVEAPEGYQVEKAAEAYEALSEDVVTVPQKKPNVIVVMNEAFSDPAVLGEFETNEDYMPFMHSLQQGEENTVTGILNVSVMGGNTANTEFEFLTGSTMAFLPDGSIPYQQYINEETESIASHLKSLGYKTIAMHPFNAAGWERDEVYPYLGFDRFYSLKNYSGVTKVRDYVSDDSCVDRIIKEFEKSTEPCFLFTVTMQNHSPYTSEFDNFTPDITVEGSSSVQLSQYLSLMKLSDASLQRLIEYFSDVEEDTVVVFFGDHQPTDSVVKDIWRLNGIDPKNLTEEQECLRYQVPFAVWANYDIEEQTNVVTSSNFLGAQVFEWCNIPKSEYQTFLLEVQEDTKAVTARTVIDNSGKFIDFNDVRDKLLDYNVLQYYRLFE